MYLQNPLTKTQGESSFLHDDAYAEVLSLVNLQSINLPKACGPKSQAWPMFYFNTWIFAQEILIYPKYVVWGTKHDQGSV